MKPAIIYPSEASARRANSFRRRCSYRDGSPPFRSAASSGVSHVGITPVPEEPHSGTIRQTVPGPHVVKTHAALAHSANWSPMQVTSPSEHGAVGSSGVGTVEGAGAGAEAGFGGGEGGSELVFASATPAPEPASSVARSFSICMFDGVEPTLSVSPSSSPGEVKATVVAEARDVGEKSRVAGAIFELPDRELIPLEAEGAGSVDEEGEEPSVLFKSEDQ